MPARFPNCGGAKFSQSADQSSSSDPNATGGGTNTAAGDPSGTGSTSGSTPNSGSGGQAGGTNGGGSTVGGGSGSMTGIGSNTGTGSTSGSGSSTGTGGTMNCGNQILVNGMCVDFSCQSVVEISASQLQQIPARDARGICYAYHLSGAIPYSASALTPHSDAGVLSANHDVTTPQNHNPYLMASFQNTIKLLGPRVVKLAGALNATSPILVDNFLLYGVFPAALSSPNPAAYYKASGTADSGVFVGASHANYVLFDQVKIPVTPFGPNGTSSIAPIDISTSIPANVSTMLDLRAEDCGSQRQLSDIYLLFQ